jgi:hypothetical protein
MNPQLKRVGLSLAASILRHHGYDLAGPKPDVWLHDFSPGAGRDDAPVKVSSANPERVGVHALSR